jgi:hypothetical protein
MVDLVGVILVVTAAAVLVSAAVVVGAILALVRADHRNPVAYRWVSWYAARHTRI